MAPHLFATVIVRRCKKRTIRGALTNLTWILDIQGVLIDYLHIWDILYDFELQPDSEDKHLRRFTVDDQYSAKSACEGLFGIDTIWATGKSMEDLGTTQMSLFYVASCP